MAYGDDFRELIADARDAVDRLLDQSRHDAWVNLRAGYGEMCRALESDDKARKLEELASDLPDVLDDGSRGRVPDALLRVPRPGAERPR